MAVDEARVEELVGQLAGHMTGAALCLSIWLGDEVGYYRAMAGAGALGADDLAAKVGCNARLTREWLDSQAAAGLAPYDASNDVYAVSDEVALILADESAPMFMARGMNALVSLFSDGEKLRAAFEGDGGLSWGDHHPCLFRGGEWSFRPGYRAFLTTSWIPALEGVEQRLRDGARVADVGCGHGASVVVMAGAYPSPASMDSTFTLRRSTRRRRVRRRLGSRTVRSFRSRARRSIRELTISFASSTASTTWATQWALLVMRENILSPVEPCSSSSRWRSTTEAQTSQRTHWRPCPTRSLR